MKVGFYGHVRQYHDLKSELDAAILAVLESGEYVLGPALSRFERELAAFFRMKHAVAHPCYGESALKGFEIMMAACRSAARGGRVMLPLGPGEPELDALRDAMSS